MDDETQVIPTAEEQETVETTETTETQEEEVDDVRYLNQKKRAEKAEAELKALKDSLEKPTAKPKEAKKPITSDRDETFVISALSAKGLSFEEIDTYLTKAKKIAQVEDIPLAKALDTDYFKVFDKQIQDEKKREQASLEATRGSGGGVSKKTLQTPGLSDEEFNEMLKKSLQG